MKTIQKSLLAGAICASLGTTAPALADVRTIIFEGNVEYIDFYTDREGVQIDNEESIVRFRAIATYDDDRMFYDEYVGMFWRDVYYEDISDPEQAALVGLTFQFLDAMGNVVPQSSIPLEVNLDAPQVDESDFEFYQYYYDDGEFIFFDNEQVGPQDVGEYVSVDEGYDVEFDYREDLEEGGCTAEFEEDYNCGEYEYDFDVDNYNYMMMDPPLFTNTGTELEPVEYFGDGEFYFQFDHRQYEYIDGGESSYLEFYVEGEMDTIYFGLPDADADGVPDDVDQCGASLTEETVMFGEYDSSVTNYVDEQGCTIMDHYAACPIEVAPTRGIRSVRSGPSNCEKAISYELVSDGVISYGEARLLRNALYNSK